MKMKNTNKGSVILISILLVSAVLILAVIGLSDAQISSSKQQENSYSDSIVYYTAESCLEEAINRIENDISYVGETILLGNSQCVVSVSGGAVKDVSIDVTYDNYSQSFSGEISVTQDGQIYNAELLNWEET